MNTWHDCSSSSSHSTILRDTDLRKCLLHYCFKSINVVLSERALRRFFFFNCFSIRRTPIFFLGIYQSEHIFKTCCLGIKHDTCTTSNKPPCMGICVSPQNDFFTTTPNRNLWGHTEICKFCRCVQSQKTSSIGATLSWRHIYAHADYCKQIVRHTISACTDLCRLLLTYQCQALFFGAF